MENEALIELLYKMADDQLILGHRNSEWTGFGPLLEEDIAFSSMAQDKVGHSQALYTLLHSLGEQAPDTIAFLRSAEKFHNCILVELPNGEYDFSLVRHFLYDTAEMIRFEMLRDSSFVPLAQLARKIHGELRYHTLHANTWIKQLGSATEESISRLQHAMSFALPYALGIFEASPYEQTLIDTGVFAGERQLQERWMAKVAEVLASTQLQLPEWSLQQAVLGGRGGRHSEHLAPLLNEMSEVLRIDPSATW
ncbi:1,2-phenylacetyl-CoA epoxidase subunit PaaC [Chryseolinea lacunae]|uniref:Phenylacetate-CoA oxygenase subunit PaaC n=1 Tax=Chryseolinea lacunae TaxID=2801331 RepID=A0ABS1KTZ4_9BACT|nr:1,2-phenylacetyl-CoA epoxidase subunit PaaC [Chryseolinea lacunae]MBL0742805.1 phenylacetate-CoA oxygenase subunit PaaC [Chryseolinea lacunae]